MALLSLMSAGHIPLFCSEIPSVSASTTTVSISTTTAQHPFSVGELLQFEIAWGALSVGTAFLEVRDIVEVSSRPAYHFVSEAKSSSFLDGIYKVRDRNEAWMDVQTLESHGYQKSMREGGYRREETVAFDLKQRKFFAKSYNPKKKTESFSEGPIPAFALDVLSSLYYLRTQNLAVGSDVIMDVNTKKNWPLVVKVKKRETVKVPAGKFDCFLVEPLLREEGLFVKKGKKLEVWLTADEKKTPVLMKSKIFIGSVEAKLQSKN